MSVSQVNRGPWLPSCVGCGVMAENEDSIVHAVGCPYEHEFTEREVAKEKLRLKRWIEAQS